MASINVSMLHRVENASFRPGQKVFRDDKKFMVFFADEVTCRIPMADFLLLNEKQRSKPAKICLARDRTYWWFQDKFYWDDVRLQEDEVYVLLLQSASRWHDWGFYSDDPQGALGGSVAHWCFWWNENYQTQFNRIWDSDADSLADELADQYGYIWPWLIGRVLPVRAPETFARIEGLLSDEKLISRTQGTNPVTVLSNSIVWGAFHAVRKRRTWAEPKVHLCPVCKESFWGGALPIWTYHQFGTARYCFKCCLRVRDGNKEKQEPIEVVASLKRLADARGSVPSQAFSFEVLASLPDDQRDAITRALCCVPDAATIKLVLGAKTWLNALQIAGLVGEGWRPSRGTWCIAEDGHRCRSLLEKSIDDWFSRNKLEHECEPYWPVHKVYNATGRRRADWLLPSGSLVECVGMMSDKGYVAKIRDKQMLALEAGIKLYLVSPSDILSLDRLFRDEICQATVASPKRLANDL